MINNGVFEILMHIPEEYKADFFSGNLYRIGTNLHDAKTGRIVAHLTEIGEPLDITGKIAKGIENATIAANNAAKTATLATQVTIGIGVSCGTVVVRVIDSPEPLPDPSRESRGAE